MGLKSLLRTLRVCDVLQHGIEASDLAQRTRIGPITQGSVDRNYQSLENIFYPCPLFFSFGYIFSLVFSFYFCSLPLLIDFLLLFLFLYLYLFLFLFLFFLY